MTNEKYKRRLAENNQVWIVELLYWIKPRLPARYRLLLVDVHRRPVSFSFADRVAQELKLEQPPCSAPFAVAYRVGEQAPSGGQFLALWRRHLAVGSPLPVMWLRLSVRESVPVDLEATYHRATEAAYLS